MASLRAIASTPRRGAVEAATLVGLYGVYEILRGKGNTTVAAARAHTDEVVSLERHLHVFSERAVQHAAHWVPGGPALLGMAYLVLHFLGTAGLLVWVHRRHRERFPLVRNTLVVASGLALVVYNLYPVAPPRLAHLGFVDTVTRSAKVNLSSDLLSSLYNPFAAVPSLHFGYALLVGATVGTLARRRLIRILGSSYPLVMLLVIVATGNHFFVDAAGGALAVGAGYLAARKISAPAASPASKRRPVRESAVALS